ncbi:Fanconi anemia group M protein isoform X2 [Erinaceus europaeus]|uniref:Fanconi anemia group M protein isoform X2 n=1 Tax=Erinaceus europaeus TaxID=9365 RepID=A0ABM3W4Q2_ERIEU|nr:Fanconi anemia group M protein isoform X2 [Erinaceus europaeus]
MSGRPRTLPRTWGSGPCLPPPPRAEGRPPADGDGDAGGFCPAAGALWIYPTQCPVRDYQLRMAGAALLRNTLLCLPTGLGKTFVAAVVMYNFYRWFPAGKVVFLAPSRPLVAQQMEACFRVMGIPRAHMAQVTGATPAGSRRQLWRGRVLFLTPQVLANDLARGACPAAAVKCLVVDEAHRALGNHAYCQVVRELVKYTSHFRILALSATPGSDMKAVQQVITNLLIGQIELRSEESPDILPYSHERRVEKIVVPLGEELAAIQRSYLQILEAFASCLIQRNILMRRDIANLTKYQIILARDQFRKNPSPNILGIQQGIIEGEFAICISLYHGYELLQQMGLRSLYLFLCGIMDGTKGVTRTKTELSRNEDFMTLYSQLEGMFAQTCGTSEGDISPVQKGDRDKNFFYSHPKLKKLEEVVVEHFTSWNARSTSEKKCDETRVMIFSSFRDSVQEIAAMLKRHQPVIRVMTFVGHASGKSVKGFTQKEQLEVVKQFRSGGYNTLVSTCVGEEGLDIGEVDLIVCFDAQKSPIRLVQRMGRTGRRRQGRIVVILTEGREEREVREWSLMASIHSSIRCSSHVVCMSQRNLGACSGNLQPFLPGMTEEPAPGTRQLSLSEWSVWQDHPFPTHQVGHSDRCLHFINIMQMIEGMRREENECSYELEIQPFLQMEDVSPTFIASKNAYHSLANSVSARHKKSSCTKNINQGSFFSVTEPKEKGSGNCRQPLATPARIAPLKDRAPKELEDQSEKAESEVAGPALATDGNCAADNVCQADLLQDKRASGRHEVVVPCAHSDSVTQPCGLVTGCRLMNKPAGNFSDSGYNSFSDEKSASSSMLFPLEEELCSSKTDEEFNCSSVTEELAANVESFLSRSPPPLTELTSLECEILGSSALQNLLLSPHTENLENAESPCLTVVDSPQDLTLEPHELTSHLVEKCCLYRATNDKVFDKPKFCDYDNKIHKAAQNENSASCTHIHTNTEHPKYFAEKNQDIDSGGLPISHPHQDESLILFEDVNMEVSGVSLSASDSECKSPGVSEKDAINEHGLLANFSISDELLFDNNPEPQDQIVCINSSCRSHEDLRAVHGDREKSGDCAFDGSKEIFSVTFDLGFRAPDSDDENLERISDTKKNGSVDDASGQCADVKNVGVIAAPSPGLCGADCILNQVTPEGSVDCSTREDKQSSAFAPSVAKEKGCISPGYSQFSLPVREKVMSTPLSESNTWTPSYKKNRQMPKTPDSNRGRINPQSSKETLNLTFDDLGLPVEKKKSGGKMSLHQSCYPAAGEHLRSSESEDDVIFRRKTSKPKRDLLESPENQKNSDVDSPLQAVRKHRTPLNRLELSSSDEDDNFQQHSHLEDFEELSKNAKRILKVQKKQSHLKLIARKFLDDEAELSEDEECVSSDERDESESEQNSSLLDFLNDEPQLSQAVDDSEMRAIYIKSLRSPEVGNQYRRMHTKSNVNVFSQIPEQDETYLEDSFCVDKEESSKSQSSEEEVCVDFNITEDFFENGSKKYKTRHAVKLKEMKMRQNCAGSKKKLSRIILPDDSSEEEKEVTEQGSAGIKVGPGVLAADRQPQGPCVTLPPPGSSLQPGGRGRAGSEGGQVPDQTRKTPLPDTPGFNPQAPRNIASTSPFTSVDSQTDFTERPANLKGDCALEVSGTLLANFCSRPQLVGTRASLQAPREDQRACILVDSREVTSGAEVISSLRAIHGFHVEVCPLNGCDYIVSNRMVVERRYHSEMANSLHKRKLIGQIQYLQNLFERICVIVEKDREKAGESSRIFKRTKSYDSLLTALISAGIRILFSSCQEETADLLKELSLVEQRKNVGIHVPTVVNSSKWEALQFYLSIPNISYITALNMCHQFSSVKKMTNSTAQEISMYARVTQEKAEEIHRYIRCLFDVHMLPDALRPGRLRSPVSSAC